MRLLLEVIGLALTTIRENKVRAFLTVLGVIIGTGTIIGVGSILAGLDGAVTGAIRSLGTNTVMVMKNQFGGLNGGGGRTPEERQRKPLTYENSLAIQERCPAVENVSAYLLPPNVFGPALARYKGNDSTAQIAGVGEHYVSTGQADMKAGRFFTGNEDVHRFAVAVIGEDVAKALFGADEAIGKTINAGGAEVQVIGVMNRPAASIPGAGRQPRADTLFHHAQAISQCAGAHAHGRGQTGSTRGGDGSSARGAAPGTALELRQTR